MRVLCCGVELDFDDQRAGLAGNIAQIWKASHHGSTIADKMFSTGKCYAREGVNHLEKCGKYRGLLDRPHFTISI